MINFVILSLLAGFYGWKVYNIVTNREVMTTHINTDSRVTILIAFGLLCFVCAGTALNIISG